MVKTMPITVNSKTGTATSRYFGSSKSASATLLSPSYVVTSPTEFQIHIEITCVEGHFIAQGLHYEDEGDLKELC